MSRGKEQSLDCVSLKQLSGTRSAHVLYGGSVLCDPLPQARLGPAPRSDSKKHIPAGINAYIQGCLSHWWKQRDRCPVRAHVHTHISYVGKGLQELRQMSFSFGIRHIICLFVCTDCTHSSWLHLCFLLLCLTVTAL